MYLEKAFSRQPEIVIYTRMVAIKQLINPLRPSELGIMLNALFEVIAVVDSSGGGGTHGNQYKGIPPIASITLAE